MWTLVEPDNIPGHHSADTDAGHGNRPPGTLASRLPDLDESAIHAIVAAPAKKASVWRTLGYTLLSLLLAAGLIAQISYRHLDHISQHQTLRPWLLAFCDVARCVLPTRQDSNMIVSQSLAIEPHPDFRAVSRMTVSFTNTADYPQPLPAIELVYSDTTGHELAGRRFYPRHYLNNLNNAPNSAPNNELSAPAAIPTPLAMPAGQSRTVHLDFADPTADAVNYQVRFVYE